MFRVLLQTCSSKMAGGKAKILLISITSEDLRFERNSIQSRTRIAQVCVCVCLSLSLSLCPLPLLCVFWLPVLFRDLTKDVIVPRLRSSSSSGHYTAFLRTPYLTGSDLPSVVSLRGALFKVCPMISAFDSERLRNGLFGSRACLYQTAANSAETPAVLWLMTGFLLVKFGALAAVRMHSREVVVMSFILRIWTRSKHTSLKIEILSQRRQSN